MRKSALEPGLDGRGRLFALAFLIAHRWQADVPLCNCVCDSALLGRGNRSKRLIDANGGRKARGGIARYPDICGARVGDEVIAERLGIQSQLNRGPHGPRSPSMWFACARKTTDPHSSQTRTVHRLSLFTDPQITSRTPRPRTRLGKPRPRCCQGKRRAVPGTVVGS